MHRITYITDEKETLDTTVTIDAAIVRAKELHAEAVKASPGSQRMLAVRDGTRIRVMVGYDGKACWMVPCKKCKGTGKASAVSAYSMYGSQEACTLCYDGQVADLPCQ